MSSYRLAPELSDQSGLRRVSASGGKKQLRLVARSLAVVLISSMCPLVAQSIDGFKPEHIEQILANSLCGTVLDTSGAAVGLASVTVEGNGWSRSLSKVESAGAFCFQGLPSGKAVLTITAQGFAPFHQLLVLAHTQGRRDYVLQLAYSPYPVDIRPAAMILPEPAPAASRQSRHRRGILRRLFRR